MGDYADLIQHNEDWLAREHVMRYRFAKQYLPRAGYVLDIACGPGYGTYHIARTAPQVEMVGVDILAENIEVARRFYSANNASFLVADAFRLPFFDESFNLLLSFETIEHVHDGAGFLAEMARVLNRDGVFLCSTPNAPYDFLSTQHVRLYTPQELSQTAQRFFGDVQLFYQYQSRADRFVELRDRWQGFAITRILGAIPGPIRRYGKRILRRTLQGSEHIPTEAFMIEDHHNYPADAVSMDPERSGSVQRVIVIVCRRPLLWCGTPALDGKPVGSDKSSRSDGTTLQI
jgi:ubiquinone/menaquinone biosynthesis C-methylase UbiE